MTCDSNCNKCEKKGLCPFSGKCKCCIGKVFIAFIIVALLVLGFNYVSAAHVVDGGCHNAYGYGISCGSGGGGSGRASNSSSLQRDFCPDGDLTFSYYDGLCDDGVKVELEEVNTEIKESASSVFTETQEKITIISSEYEVVELINELKEEQEVIVPVLETIVLPTFLPETGAL